MAKLDLFSDREPHIIELAVNGEKKQFRVPTDYTEEEIERILELESKVSESADLTVRRNLIFQQLHILFRHYQAEMTLEDVKKLLTWNDALKIINFVAANTMTSKKSDAGEVEEGSKKAQGKS
jgi:hypothetical protein